MKLIDEKEVEKASKNHSIFENSQRYDCVKLDSFIEGVEFAEQKIIPLMSEFAKYCIITGVRYDIGKDNEEDEGFFREISPDSELTIEQLIEDFLHFSFNDFINNENNKY